MTFDPPGLLAILAIVVVVAALLFWKQPSAEQTDSEVEELLGR